MPNEKNTKSENVGQMNKRREIMADGKRYLIYYTFGSETIATTEATAIMATPSGAEDGHSRETV